MKEKHGIRTLAPDEIECRVGVIRSSGLSLLLYKDARVDQRLLDEVFGPFGWKREHSVIDGSVYCTVSVKDADTGEWISKQDVGSAGPTEKEKSLASDSFKRACVNWGIGRELYTAPFIWIPAGRARIETRNGKPACSERFRVAEISYTPQREIASLVIEKEDGTRAFAWQRAQDTEGSPAWEAGENAASGSSGKRKDASGITQEQKGRLREEMERTGVTMAMVDRKFHVGSTDEMSPGVYKELMKALRATKSKAA